MNAYELADELGWLSDEYKYVEESSTMLRQQADRIAELEKIVKNTIGQAFYEDDFHKAEDKIACYIQTLDAFAEENAKLLNKVAELEKDLEGCEYFLKSHTAKQLTLDMIYKVSEATPINNEDEWFDAFAKNLIKEISND